MIRLRAPYVAVFVGEPVVHEPSEGTWSPTSSTLPESGPGLAMPTSSTLPESGPGLAMPSLTTPGRSGPPAWYDDAASALGDAMWKVTAADYDAFWLDRLVELLRLWEVDMMKRADAIRPLKPFS